MQNNHELAAPKMSKKKFLEELPIEVLSAIFSFLPFHQINQFVRFNKFFYRLFKGRTLLNKNYFVWQKKFEAELPQSFSKILTTFYAFPVPAITLPHSSQPEEGKTVVGAKEKGVVENAEKGAVKNAEKGAVKNAEKGAFSSETKRVLDVSLPDSPSSFWLNDIQSFYLKEDGVTIDVNKVVGGVTILYWAIRFKDLETVKNLICLGSKVDETYFEAKYQPIHIAAMMGRLDIVKFLVESNRNLYLQDKMDAHDQSPLWWATLRDHRDVVEYLLDQDAEVDGVSTDKNSEDRNTNPFYLAIEKRYDIKLIKKFLDKCATYHHECGSMWFQPIHLAVRQGRLDVVKLLIELDLSLLAAADPCPQTLLEAADACRQTPLLWAAAKGYTEIVLYLLSKNPRVNVASHRPGHKDHGKTPLYWAIERGHDAVMVDALLKAGADPWVPVGPLQYQPIHIAAKSGRLDIVQLLLQCCNNLLKAEDAFGQTALDLARMEGHQVIVDYLEGFNSALEQQTNNDVEGAASLAGLRMK